MKIDLAPDDSWYMIARLIWLLRVAHKSDESIANGDWFGLWPQKIADAMEREGIHEIEIWDGERIVLTPEDLRHGRHLDKEAAK